MAEGEGRAPVWADRLRAAIPELAARPLLAPLRPGWTVLLHGSTAAGVDDAYSDLDLWALVSAANLADLDRRSDLRRVEFDLDGKLGAIEVVSVDELAARLHRCDMPLIAELRSAEVLEDRLEEAEDLLLRARLSMAEDVRRVWFQHHYVQMRSSHRTAIGPLERGDRFAALLAIAETVAHALRAAMVLDGEPYPYDKWLAARATRLPTGRAMTAAVEQVLTAIQAGAHHSMLLARSMGLESAIREIRAIAAQAGRDAGIGGPWLRQWYLYLHQTRSGIETCRWPELLRSRR